MNSILAQENSDPVSVRARILRWAPAILIVLAALIYYSTYIYYWFNPHDEGGTACLIAQRLMQGEKPWVDVDPGYNVGWFYPLVALFKITGVNYIAARTWFFTLATITALLGCFTATRISGSRWLGLGVGLALVALPGSQFKNYIPLVQAANTACLIGLAFVDPKTAGRWLGLAALSGFVLGLTYLLRVEIGFFFTAIWAGYLLLSLLDRRAGLGRRFVNALLGAVCLAGGVVVAQAPVYLHLRSQGLEQQYWHEYSGWLSFLQNSIEDQLEKTQSRPKHSASTASSKAAQPSTSAATSTPAPTATPAPVAVADPTSPEVLAPLPKRAPTPVPSDASPSAPASSAVAVKSPRSSSAVESQDRSILPRYSLSDMFKTSGKDRFLPFLTYAPLVGFGVFLLLGTLFFLRTVFRREFRLNSSAMLWPLLVGCSLTTFPQFFFFRPDRPHLSEFMPGFIVAVAASLWLLWRPAHPLGKSRKLLAAAMTVFLVLHFTAFGIFAMQHPSSGTVAARYRGRTWFHGENGVHCRGTKREFAEFTMVHDAVMAHSRPGDYVICFPYMPGYNVMVDRPTYLYNVYVDNATRSSDFAKKTIWDFENRKPAIVIIDDRAINGVDSSRFSHWGGRVVKYLKANYTSVGKFEDIEVFARPEAAK